MDSGGIVGKENEMTTMTSKARGHVSEAEQNIENISPTHDGSPRTCPQTPANRIPLADLVGNTEDAFDRPTADKTPDDHVYWQTGPRSSDPSNSVSSQRRSKKRSHSSSPAPSRLEKSNNLPPVHVDGSLNLQNLQQYLKTPHNDPALDLWNRYADTGGTRQDEERTLTAFANIVSSSPQTPGTTSSKKGLRKAVSCGIEWPVSRPKKVKLDGTYSIQKAEETLAQSEQEILFTEAPKASKVNLLMEKIQESLINGPRVAVKQPSSSSPLPERTHLSDGMDLLPIIEENEEHVANDKESNNPRLPQSGPLQEEHPNVDREPTRLANVNDGSSDYGDDVFDNEFGEPVKDILPVPDNAESKQVEASKGDLEFEAMDFEDLVAAIDADDVASHNSGPHEDSTTKQSSVTQDDLEDIFGDDNDEDLWNAVSTNVAIEERRLQEGQKTKENQVRTNLS